MGIRAVSPGKTFFTVGHVEADSRNQRATSPASNLGTYPT